MKIKNRWEDLTFNEVLQIQQIISADINETYKVSNIIAVLAGVENDDVENLPINQFTSLAGEIEFLNTPIPKVKHQDFYTVNGNEYKLAANITEISTAQYIDYQAYMKEENPDLARITTVFFIPKGHKYNDGYDVEEVYRDVSDMKYIDIEAIAFFLRKQFALYTMITADSLRHQMKKKKMSKKEIKELQSMILHLDNMALSLL